MFFFEGPARNGKRAGNPMWASIRGEEVLHVGSVYAAFMDSTLHLLRLSVASLSLRVADAEAARAADRRGGAVGRGGGLHDPLTLQLRLPVSPSAVPAEPAQDRRHRLGLPGGLGRAHARQLAVCVPVQAWRRWHRNYLELLVVGFGVWSLWVHCLWWVSFDLGWFLS